MELRSGRFGKFLASVNYPEVRFVVNLDKQERIKYPAQPPVETELPCPKCEAPLNVRRGKRGPWLGCSRFPKCRGRASWTKLDEPTRQRLERQLDENDREHPPIVLETLDGKVIPEGTPISELTIPGGLAELEIHPEAETDHSPNHRRTEAA
jgi:DNA topoisomerase-1